MNWLLIINAVLSFYCIVMSVLFYKSKNRAIQNRREADHYRCMVHAAVNMMQSPSTKIIKHKSKSDTIDELHRLALEREK